MLSSAFSGREDLCEAPRRTIFFIQKMGAPESINSRLKKDRARKGVKYGFREGSCEQEEIKKNKILLSLQWKSYKKYKIEVGTAKKGTLRTDFSSQKSSIWI